MNEIEKLYKNAGIEPYIYCSKPRLDCYARETGNCKQDCEYYSGAKLLISFTADKQIELIKWLADRPLSLIIGRRRNKYYFGNSNFSSKADVFDNALAGRINDLWYFITEEEKEQVRGILE